MGSEAIPNIEFDETGNGLFLPREDEKTLVLDQLIRERLGLTFDDFEIEDAPSDYAVQDIDLTCNITRNVTMNIPLMGAAMDTVTEHRMGIALALCGGAGVIHAAMSPERQAEQTRIVKWSLNGMVENPISGELGMTLGQTTEKLDKEYPDRSFGTVPIVDEEKRLRGLMPEKYFKININNPDRLIEDVMIPRDQVVTAPPGTTPEEAYGLMVEKSVGHVLIVGDEDHLQAMYVLSDVQRISSPHSKLINVDSNDQLVVGAALPTDESALARIEAIGRFADFYVVDTSKGGGKYMKYWLPPIIDAAHKQGADVIAGNVSDARSAYMLCDLGADGIKVGKGRGSICTTTGVTGNGTPQAIAVQITRRAVDSYDPTIGVIVDGGLRTGADLSKGITFGADAGMAGRMLAGSAETPGEVFYSEILQARAKKYRGMGAAESMEDNVSNRNRYYGEHDKEGSSKETENIYKRLPQGVSTDVPFVGPVEPIVIDAMMGLRESMSSAGAQNIKEHQQKSLFWRRSEAGAREAKTHDIINSGL